VVSWRTFRIGNRCPTCSSAESDISGAIADKEIKGVRLTVVVTDVLMPYHQMVAKVQGLGSDPKYSASTVECFEGMNVKIPDHLTPDVFDWQNSRPLQAWGVRPHGGRRDEWQSFAALLIELCTAEVSTWIQRTYRSGWERLGDALTRVAATGIDEAQAKRKICTAIGERKVNIQVCAGTVHNGEEFEIPADLTPSDFNWQKSRPLRPWRLKTDEVSRREEAEAWSAAAESSRVMWRVRTGRLDPLSPAPPLSVDWIELFKDDVTKVLCSGERANSKAQEKAAAAGAKTRGIQEAINQLWPGGIPEGLIAKDRNNAIRAQLGKNGSSVPRDQALARAVQRALKARRSK
jgi:hypothetical protein